MGHWFKHDSDASEDEKLLTLKAIHGKAGLCDWWTLCEILSSKEDAKYSKKYLLGLTKKLELTQDELNTFIETLLSLELLVEEDGFIFSRSMVERLEEYEATKERNRNKKRGQRGDIEGTSKGQSSEIEGDASISNSISNSRSLDLNKNSEVSVSHLGKTERAKDVWLDDSEIELAKSFYSKIGMDAGDVETFAINELSRHYEKFPEKVSKNLAYRDLISNWLLKSIADLKTSLERKNKTKDPPENKKSFFEIEQEAKAKAEAEAKESRRLLMERKQKELGFINNATR